MKLRTALFGAGLAAALIGATGAQASGWYIGLEGGGSWVESWKHQFNGATRTAEFDTGWNGFATVGYAWGSHFRTELEAGYRDNNLDRYLNNLGAPITTAKGSLWEASAMANFIYDLPLTDNIGLSLGAGAGADFADLTLTNPVAALGTSDAGNWNFAYQGIAGMNYALGRNTSLVLNYRYMRVQEPDFRLLYGAGPRNVAASEDMVKHAATIGLRYAFGAAAEPMAPAPSYVPPPVPATPNAPPKQFIVFFGYNKYNLTPEALRVISEAVTAAKHDGTASILVTGHTDTMGTPAYNQRLSMRRSNTVKAEMVRQGIPTGAITTSGRGENELLVQTADNVKEPQNRRATIDLN